MMKEEKEMIWYGNPRKKSNLTLYLEIFTLLICSRLFDIYTTYLVTPDLKMESNLLVIYLGLGWVKLIFLNMVIILIFFLLFRFSWSKLTKRYLIRRRSNVPHCQEIKDDVSHPLMDKHIRSSVKHRNISLEIGITLPIFVIITGYFQGVINIMIHMELIIVSFTNFLYLYPLVTGLIFGYISLFLAKQFLYLGRPWFNKKAHKIRMPKRTKEDEGETKNSQATVEVIFLGEADENKKSLNKTDIISSACEDVHILTEDI